MKIRENWRALLTAAVEGKNWAAIARVGKLGTTYVRDVVERGQTPTLDSAIKLSAGLGLDVTDWFLEAERGLFELRPPPAPRAPSPGPADELRPLLWPKDVPVMGTAACGPNGAFLLQDVPIDFIRRLPRIANIPDAYALYADGDSMSKWREHGDPVYVAPRLPVLQGNRVVIQVLNDKREVVAYIKELVRRTEKEIKVRQYNPAQEFSFATKNVVKYERILEWTELLGI